MAMGLFGLGLPELIILAVVGVGFLAAVVAVVVILVVVNKPKGPTND